MKNTTIQSLIYRNYLKSSLIPIFVIEVTLLVLYFSINYYISEKNRSTLLSEATENIKEIASREVHSINRQLVEVNDLAVIMQRDHEAFFADPSACYLPNGNPAFDVHPNGALFKPFNNGGSSLYYSSTTLITDRERRKARCSEMLDPLLVSLVETSPLVTQAYLNTWDDMNRLYPFMEDAPGQYGAAINMEDYNFYYDADADHNPERKPVWTGAYLDPAGQGWMVSVIVPIYTNDFLEGVSGLDVTIDSFVQNILSLQFPWDAGTFMVDSNGTILAMQERVENILGLQELGKHDYSENIKETIAKPEEFTLFRNPDTSIKQQFTALFESKARIATITINQTDFLISQEIVAETGWRMMTLIEKNRVFAPITELKTLSNKIGFYAVIAMIFFYVIFFGYLLVASRKLTGIIAAPVIKLSELTKDLGNHLKTDQITLSGIDELDTLAKNFNVMSYELNTAINKSQTARQEADTVISNFLDSLIVVDKKQQIRRVNKETCSLLGYSENELIGKAVGELFSEETEAVHAFFSFPFREETNGKNELRNIELTLIAKDNRSLPVSINIARLNNRAGQTIGVVAGAKDISELKNTLRQTEKQKQFIHEIFDTVPGGLLVIDKNSQLLQVNSTFASLLINWSKQYGFATHELRQNLLSGLKTVLLEKQYGEIKLSGTKGDLIIEYHSSSVDLSAPEIQQVIFLHDFTERHNAESVRRLLSTVLEQTSEGILVTNTEGLIEYSNIAIEKMSGFSREDLAGKTPAVFHSGHQDKTFYQDLWSTIEKGEVWSGSLTNKRLNSTFFEVEMVISPVRSNNEKITHYVSLWRDISQVRSLQRQLLQSQKMEAIGQLAAGVAHEINTPMQYIESNLAFITTSFTEITPLLNDILKSLQDQTLTLDDSWRKKTIEVFKELDVEFLCEEIPESLEETTTGVKHVTRIIAAMKEFAHPGKEEKSRTDLNRLLDNAVVMTKNEWKYTATLTTDFDPELPALYSDPVAISQVMINLIINAADAIKEKSKGEKTGKILLSTTVQNSFIEIRIQDNGIGIDKEINDKIFEPFFTTKQIGKGSGQGLAIAYDIIVNKHGGNISCESQPGIGTTMLIRFPFEK